MPTLREFLDSASIFRDTYQTADSSATGSGYDFWNKLVQFGDDPTMAASGEATMLFSGPPVYDKAFSTGLPVTGSALLVPIGAVQGIQDGGSNNIVPYREVGSKLKRVARGSADYRMTFGRVLTYHSSLAHALYAWLAKFGAEDTRPDKWALSPGSDGSQLNILDSDLFGIPFGCLLMVVSGGGRLISQEYWEGCYVADLGKAVGAGQPLVQEQVSLFVTRKVAASEITLADPGTIILPITAAPGR